MNNIPMHEINSITAIGFGELLIVFLVVAFALMFIITLIAKKSSGAVALLVGLGLMGLLGGGVLLSMIMYWRMSAVAHQAVGIQAAELRDFTAELRAAPSAPPVLEQVVDRSLIVSSIPPEQVSAWDDSISATANVYPSIAECGVPLATRIADALVAKGGTPKTRYAVKLTNQDLSATNLPKFTIQFRKTFLAKFPASSVTKVDPAKKTTPPAEAAKAEAAPVIPESPVKIVNVRLTKVLEEAPGPQNWPSDFQGQVVCDWSEEGDDAITDAVEFINKPWVSNPSKFFSTPNGKNQLSAYSSRLASSQHEAHRSAMEAFRRQFRETQNRSFHANFNIEDAVADRFVQKLTMPYGSVWREAVLVKTDAAPVQLQQPMPVGIQARMSNGHPATVSKNRVRTSPEFLLALLAGLVIAVGWVSNVLTQGYYRKPINTATLIGVSIGVIVLILLVVLSIG